MTWLQESRPNHGPTAAITAGWLLLTPVIRQTAAGNGNEVPITSEAPMSKWKVLGEFQSAKDCEGVRQLLNPYTVGISVLITASTLCIASDDPRLKVTD